MIEIICNEENSDKSKTSLQRGAAHKETEKILNR